MLRSKEFTGNKEKPLVNKYASSGNIMQETATPTLQKFFAKYKDLLSLKISWQ